MSDPKFEMLLQPIIQGDIEDRYDAVCEVAIVGADSSMYTCTGTLISPTLVLCAAHCVDAPRIRSATCVFSKKTRSAKTWYWDKHFSQELIESNVSEVARLAAVGYDYTILELDKPITNITPMAMMEFETFKNLAKQGRIRELVAVGFGRFSKSESTNTLAGVKKRSAKFTKFSIQPYTETIKVYPQTVKSGEPVSISVGDSGGPYIAKVGKHNYVVATVSTVTRDSKGDSLFATAVSVSKAISFFRDSLLLDYRQSSGPLGFSYVAPLDERISEVAREFMIEDSNVCVGKYCPERNMLVACALGMLPFAVYAYLATSIRDS